MILKIMPIFGKISNSPFIMRKICLLAVVMVAAVMMQFAACDSSDNNELKRGKPSKELVAAADAFYEATKSEPKGRDHINLHSIMVLTHGKVVLERWYNGESAEKPHTMWSVSKTFTAAAIGFAIDEGLIKVDDKVIKYFPDKLPAQVSDNLAAMTIRDLLTMTCGHDVAINFNTYTAPDWVEGFLAEPVTHTPGTYFVYNSVGTYMLSAIITKVTGQDMNDYLEPRLWQPLGIDKPEWDKSPQGMSCGGWGLHLKTEDMARMGQCMLQNGKWKGKQVIPASWVREMSTYKVESGPAGTRLEDMPRLGITKENNQWAKGYCYQMWICSDNGYRADGANGQYFMVFPDKDAVLVLTTDSNLYQPYMDIIWKYLIPVL